MIFLKKLLSIFDGKIGEGFSAGELATEIETAKSRFENKIPPGYMDDSKEDERGVWRLSFLEGGFNFF